MRDSDVLCTEFKVACDICYCNKTGELVSRNNVVSRLGDILSKEAVTDSIHFLINWGIVRVNLTNDNLLLYISSDTCKIVSELCERYWIPAIRDVNR